MARTSPHLITTKSLLKFNMQQLDIQAIMEKLERHCRAVKKLRKAGLQWDSETGTISPIKKKGQQ